MAAPHVRYAEIKDMFIQLSCTTKAHMLMRAKYFDSAFTFDELKQYLSDIWSQDRR